MKLKPINVLQLALMAIVVTAPVVGADWPGSATWAQIAVAAASGVLGTVNLYAPPLQPTTLLGPQGLQTVHVVQGLVSTLVSTLATIAATQPHNPSLAAAAHIASTVGGVVGGVLGLFSPQAYLGPVASYRLRMAAAASARGSGGKP